MCDDFRSASWLVPTVRFLVCALIVSAPWEIKAETDRSVSPRCAWIDAGNTQVLVLAEAKVLADHSGTWLERKEITRLLTEKRLQEAFGAGALAERVVLGQLLRADVLVLAMTGVQNEQPFAELVVAETAGGLRILSRRIPLSGNVEADATKLARLTSDGLQKYGEAIRQVFAVSPFLSRDLGFEHAHWQTVYPRLLEDVLLAQPGVLIVELEEAEALAREYALAAPDSKPARSLPTYVLGEYRHEGRGESLRVSLTVSLRRGEELLDKVTRSMGPEEVPRYLREIASKWYADNRAPLPEPDIEAEVRTLAGRVEELSELGQWRDALDLCEAALLLAPDHEDLRYRAIRVARLAAQVKHRDLAESHKESVPLVVRSLEHANVIVQDPLFNPGKLAQALYKGRPSDRFVKYFRALDAGSAKPEELMAPSLEGREVGRRLAWQLAERFAEEENWYMWSSCVRCATAGKLPQDSKQEVYAAILKYQDELPAIVLRSIWNPFLPSVENRQFLNRLLDSPETNQTVREAAMTRLAIMDRDWRSMEERSRSIITPPTPASPDGKAVGVQLTFRPFEVKYRTSGQTASVGQTWRWQALQGNIDLLFTNGCRMLLLKGHGGAIPIRLTNDVFREQFLHPPSYDGTYIWTVLDETIFVVDPVSQRKWSIGSDDGLPDLTLSPGTPSSHAHRLQVIGLSPGKAMAVGYNGRTWCALISFDPEGKHTIEVIHEAHQSPEHREISGQCNCMSPDVAYIPGPMQLLTGKVEAGQAAGNVLVHRYGSCSHMQDHPAIIDPVGETVKISRERQPQFRRKYFVHWAGKGKVHLGTLEPVNGTVEIVIPDIIDGHLIVHGDEIHVVGREWWHGTLSGGRLESLGPVPWTFKSGFASGDFSVIRPGNVEIESAGYSNHYGPFVAIRSQQHGARLLQVLFDGSGVSLEEALESGDATKPAEDNAASVPSLKTCFKPPDIPQILWSQPSADCKDLAFTADGKHILTVHRSPDKGLRLWGASEGRLVADLLEGVSSQYLITVSRSGDYFVTGGYDGTVILWSARDWKPLHFLVGHSKAIKCMAFSCTERRLATTDGRQAIVWDVASGKEINRIAQSNGIRWLGFAPDDSTLIASSLRSHFWRIDDGSYQGSVEALGLAVHQQPDGKILGLANNLQNSLIAWDTNTETCEELASPVRGIPKSFSRDGRRMVLYRREQFVEGRRKEVYRLSVWDLDRSEEIYVYPRNGMLVTLRLSPDARTVFVLGERKPPWQFQLPE